MTFSSSPPHGQDKIDPDGGPHRHADAAANLGLETLRGSHDFVSPCRYTGDAVSPRTVGHGRSHDTGLRVPRRNRYIRDDAPAWSCTVPRSMPLTVCACRLAAAPTMSATQARKALGRAIGHLRSEAGYARGDPRSTFNGLTFPHAMKAGGGMSRAGGCLAANPCEHLTRPPAGSICS